jgi:putative transposase
MLPYSSGFTLGSYALRGYCKIRNLWQRRFWEHRVRDEEEFAAYCDYIHINPVKHGLCKLPTDWPWSSIHRFIQKGILTSPQRTAPTDKSH